MHFSMLRRDSAFLVYGELLRVLFLDGIFQSFSLSLSISSAHHSRRRLSPYSTKLFFKKYERSERWEHAESRLYYVLFASAAFGCLGVVSCRVCSLWIFFYDEESSSEVGARGVEEKFFPLNQASRGAFLSTSSRLFSLCIFPIYSIHTIIMKMCARGECESRMKMRRKSERGNSKLSDSFTFYCRREREALPVYMCTFGEFIKKLANADEIRDRDENWGWARQIPQQKLQSIFLFGVIREPCWKVYFFSFVIPFY